MWLAKGMTTLIWLMVLSLQKKRGEEVKWTDCQIVVQGIQGHCFTKSLIPLKSSQDSPTFIGSGPCDRGMQPKEKNSSGCSNFMELKCHLYSRDAQAPQQPYTKYNVVFCNSIACVLHSMSCCCFLSHINTQPKRTAYNDWTGHRSTWRNQWPDGLLNSP